MTLRIAIGRDNGIWITCTFYLSIWLRAFNCPAQNVALLYHRLLDLSNRDLGSQTENRPKQGKPDLTRLSFCGNLAGTWSQEMANMHPIAVVNDIRRRPEEPDNPSG
jgi:hypothetical protein